MRIRPRYLILAILCLIAFVVGQWFFFKARFEAALPDLEARAAERGFDIDYSSRTIGGFPFRLEAHYADARLSRSDPLLSFAIEAKQAVLIRQLLRADLSLLYFEAPRLAAAAAAPLPQGKAGELTLAFEAPAMQTSLRSEKDQLARVSVVIDQPSGATPALSIGDFKAEQLQFHLGWPLEGRRAPEGQSVTRLIMNMQARALELIGNDTGPLPATLACGEIGLEVDIPTYAPLTPQGLMLWQLEKGQVHIRKLEGSWGDVQLVSGTGTLGLTDALKPRGSLTGTVTGLAALTYAIDKTDILPPQSEEIALITLRLLRAGKKAEDEVALTFDIADGVLRLGPAPLVALGPVIAPASDPR